MGPTTQLLHSQMSWICIDGSCMRGFQFLARIFFNECLLFYYTQAAKRRKKLSFTRCLHIFLDPPTSFAMRQQRKNITLLLKFILCIFVFFETQNYYVHVLPQLVLRTLGAAFPAYFQIHLNQFLDRQARHKNGRTDRQTNEIQPMHRLKLQIYLQF